MSNLREREPTLMAPMVPLSASAVTFARYPEVNSKILAEYFIKHKVITIRADWTNKDKEILDFINQYGRYGIPVNLIYGPKNKEGILLPEILSKDIVVRGLLKAGVNNDK